MNAGIDHAKRLKSLEQKAACRVDLSGLTSITKELLEAIDVEKVNIGHKLQAEFPKEFPEFKDVAHVESLSNRNTLVVKVTNSSWLHEIAAFHKKTIHAWAKRIEPTVRRVRVQAG